MKVLLTAVNAKYIHTCPAVYSLKAYAEKYIINTEGSALPEGIDIQIAEYTINQRYQDILSGIMSYHPDVIGFSTYIWNVELVRRLIKDIRMIEGTDIQIWAGGPEASYYPESFLGNGGADLCMLGEGEDTFTRLIKRYIEKIPVKSADIKGLAYIQDTVGKEPESALVSEKIHKPDSNAKYNIVNTGLADPVDISLIPFIYSDLTLFSNRIIYYESSRGCPFSCAYCLSGRERGIRYRDLNTVFKELAFFIENNVKQVKFVDRTFNADPSFAMQIWKFIRDNDNGITNFHFEIEGERITDEELELLSGLRPGLVQMEIGVQSVNQDTLKSVHRNPDIKRIQDIMPLLTENQNINLHLDLIAGLPYEDIESFRKSFNTVYALRPHQFQVGFLKLLKGTELYDRREEFGLVCSEYAPYEVLKTKWMSYDELHMIHRISDVVDDHSSSQGFIRSLPYAERLFPDAFTMFRLLADHYSKHGYDQKKPSHSGRYEIFMDFIRDYAEKNNKDDMHIHRIIEMVRLDQALHLHPSRKMEREDTLDLPQGRVRIRTDHKHCSPVNGEADHEILEYIRPGMLLGTWAWGNDTSFGNIYSEDQLKKVYEEAVKYGMSCWDTAYVYGMGTAEKILGRLTDGGKICSFISAKFTPYHAEKLSENAVYEMFSRSCGLLGRSKLDIYWMHTPDNFDKWIGGFTDLYRSGRIGSIGLSNFDLEQIMKAERILKAEGIKIGGIQNHYSIVHRTSEQTGILDYCRENDIPFYSYMILEQGALTGEYSRSRQFPEGSERWKNYRKIMDRFERVNAVTSSIAEEHKATPAQILTAWAVSKGTVPIIGVTHPQHVKDAYEAMQIILTSEEIRAMESAADTENIHTRRIWEP